MNQNPVGAGIVNQAEDYTYSSAQIYTGEDGLLDIITIVFYGKLFGDR